MAVLAAAAEFGRDLLIERAQSSLSRAKAAGKLIERSTALSDVRAQAAMKRLVTGLSVAAVARELKTSRQTIMRGHAISCEPTRYSS